jgi:hypothetical protein
MAENKNAKLYEERLNRIVKAMQLEEPDRVPLIPPEEGYWVGPYAGYTVADVTYDYSLLAKSWEKVFTDFPEWDAAYAPYCVWSGPMFEFAGITQFTLAGKEGADQKMHQWNQVSCMSEDEYDELITDPYKFLLEKILPRRCRELDKPYPRNAIAFGKSFEEFLSWLGYWGAKGAEWKDTFGMPVLAGGFTEAPIDFLMDHLRGFKELSLDLIKLPKETIQQACEALLPLMIKWATTGTQPALFPPIFIPLHFAPFLSPRYFKEFYWPTFKKLIDSLTGLGYDVIIYCESDWTPHLEYLQELPKGKVVVEFETVDMKKAKKLLGDTACLMGNLPYELLVYGTKEKIEDYTKKLIDEAAPGGGFIMSADKIFGENVNPKCMRYWCDAVMKYGKY